MERVAEKKERKSFTDLLRVRFKGVLDPIAGLLNNLGLMPNTVTILGLVGNTIGAYLLATGHITAGGILVLLMGPVDALDGTMARLRGEPSKFGAFVDSVTDRYSELVIFAGLLVHFLLQGNVLGAGLVYFAAAGSVLVSYVKSRAEGLGFDCKVGRPDSGRAIPGPRAPAGDQPAGACPVDYRHPGEFHCPAADPARPQPGQGRSPFAEGDS